MKDLSALNKLVEGLLKAGIHDPLITVRDESGMMYVIDLHDIGRLSKWLTEPLKGESADTVIRELYMDLYGVRLPMLEKVHEFVIRVEDGLFELRVWGTEMDKFQIAHNDLNLAQRIAIFHHVSRFTSSLDFKNDYLGNFCLTYDGHQYDAVATNPLER